MNRMCPVCNQDFNDLDSWDYIVPYEENERIGTLHFCSQDCRAEFIDDSPE